MQLPRVPLRLAVLAGALLVPAVACLAGTMEDTVETQAKALLNPRCPDDQREAARKNIINIIARGDGATVDRVLRLGTEAADNRTRFDVAFILAQTRFGKSIVPPTHAGPVIDLLTKWFTAKDMDAGVRLWAAVGLANTQSEKALGLLKDSALRPDADPVVRTAVVRALAGWRGDALATHVLPIFLELVNDKDPDIRITGCDCLRLVELEAEKAVPAVELLLGAARDTSDERVWRAASSALSRLGGAVIFIKPGADEAERKQRLQAWENAWRLRIKRGAKREGEK